MVTKPKTDDLELFYPPTRADLRAWLEANHDKSPGVWVVRYKVGVKKPTVIYNELLEEALCYGWIDSVQRGLDEERYTTKITPRKPKSAWSKENKALIELLIADGLMAPPGLKAIEIAKANGSWTANDDSENLVIAQDLADALAQNEPASTFFYGLADTYKRVILQWIYSAKQPETRRRRVEETVAKAAVGKKANFPDSSS